MKRAAYGHTKMKKLCRSLQVPTYISVGILESIWHLTAREAPRGDIGKLSDEDIAIGIDWASDPLPLINALVESGWLDRDEEYRLIVHDWHEHCDEAIRKQMARAGNSFATRSQQEERNAPNIYFVQGRNSRRIKIGITEGSVDHRVKALQTGSSEPLDLLGFIPGTRAQERELQVRFAEFSTGGEWFEERPEILECLTTADNGRQRQTTADYTRAPKPVPVPVPQPEPENSPLSPQGGEAGPRREGDSGKVVSVTAAQGEVQAKASAVAAEIHARHPKARRDIGAGGVTKALLAILNLEGGTKAAKLARLDEINRNHEGWCKADQWAKDGGVFAKSLENWLAPTKGRYAVPPIRDQDDDDFARRHRMFLATDAPFSVGIR